MSEIIDEAESKDVIEINKTIVNKSHESFGFDIEIIQKIFFNTNSFFNLISDKKRKIILKTSYFTASMCFCQPFNQGNKRTAFTVMMNYLHRNGFTIAIPDVGELIRLLSDISYKFDDDNATTSDLEEYISNYIEKL